MLKLNEIKAAPGSNRQRRRIGRGPGSGKGHTAGKGNNGDGQRSGSHTKPYFEGGQTPLTRRLPKRGFHSPFKTDYQIVNLRDLENIDKGSAGGKEITFELLIERGLINDPNRPLKVLGDGELTRAIIVSADSFSKTAKEKIEKAKGKAEVRVRG